MTDPPATDDGVDWGDIRELFPAVTHVTYLNTAGGGPVSLPAAEAARRFYEEASCRGDLHWDDWLERLERTRRKAASLFGAGTHEIAFLSNASLGLNVAADLLARLGCCAPGRNAVVCPAGEFPSVTLPWLQRGYDVHFLDTEPDGSVPDGRIADALDAYEDIRVVALSSVDFRTGFRHDLASLAAACRQRGVRLIVDATQGAGVFPFDGGNGNGPRPDVVVFSGYKWLNAGYGVASLYVAEELLDGDAHPVVGWRSGADPYALVHDRLELADHAAALEMGHPPFAAVFALGAALDLLADIGVDAVAERVLRLTGYLHQRLDEAGLGVRSTRAPASLSGITAVDVADPSAVAAELARQDIAVSARGHGLRVSTHHYNRRADVDRLIETLVKLSSR